jgi:GntR family transcriptional regulator
VQRQVTEVFALETRNHEGIPLYVWIRAMILDRIRDGRWPAQFQLPSEDELARQFQVSRMTLRHALQQLVQQGALYRRRGVGTFVSPIKLERDLSRLTSFSEDAAAARQSTSSTILSIRTAPATDQEQEHLQLLPCQQVVWVERVRYRGDTPIAMQVLRVPKELCPELANHETAAGSFYAYYEQVRGFRLGWGIESIEAGMPTRKERSLLQIPPRTAVLLVRRRTFLEDGTPLELSETRYRGDEHAFTVTLRR